MILRGLKRIAVVQPLPGIGDMIWHLPHIRAIAGHAGAAVTLITKPRSAADQLLGADPAVADVMWVDRNPEDRPGRHDGLFGQARFIRDLRERDFEAVVLLHHSHTLAFAAMAAGIKRRYGYGYGLQRRFLNRPPFLPPGALPLHPFEQATAWLKLAGIPMPETEPLLSVAPAASAALATRLSGRERPYLTVGIGSSEPYKQWGAPRFAELATALAGHGWRSIVLVGGKAETGLAEEILRQLGPEAASVLPAIGWSLPELAALFAKAAFYVGNDTGVMNMAAASGIPTYGLFGGTPPFGHASRIIPVLPPDGRIDKADGMARIGVQHVLWAIEADRGHLRPG
jgi:heptosyltransferase-2